MKRSFFFHYNKPASQRAGKPQITFHYTGNCHIVDNVDCRVPTIGKINKKQPVFVMCGKAEYVEIRDKVAYVLY